MLFDKIKGKYFSFIVFSKQMNWMNLILIIMDVNALLRATQMFILCEKNGIFLPPLIEIVPFFLSLFIHIQMN